MTDSVMLKGDNFVNRYRIEGKLTTTSPFHLGSGFVVERKGLDNEKTEKAIHAYKKSLAINSGQRRVRRKLVRIFEKIDKKKASIEFTKLKYISSFYDML